MKKAAPAKKAAAPKAKANKPVAAPVCSYQEKRSVRITEADNGFSVSTYGRNGENIMVAKSEAEAIRHAKHLLKSKP